MVNLRQMSIFQLLSFSTTALINGKNNVEIQSALAKYGYDVAKMEEGWALLQEAKALHNAQIQEYNEKRYKSSDKNNARKTAETIYIKYVKLARIAFKNNPVQLRHLGIVGKRTASLTGFLTEATQFYNAALHSEMIQEELGKYGITVAKLTEGKAAIDALISSDEAQLQAKANAERSTQIRNEKVAELEEWMSSFIKVARIALEEIPQMMEALGVVVKQKR